MGTPKNSRTTYQEAYARHLHARLVLRARWETRTRALPTHRWTRRASLSTSTRGGCQDVGIQQTTESHPTVEYCAIWMLYFTHLMLLNPSASLEQVYATMYNRPPHFLRAVIRRADIRRARAEIEENLCERCLDNPSL